MQDKTEKKIAILFHNSQGKRWFSWGIYGVNSHSELNIKTLHVEMIHFHWYEPTTRMKSKWKSKVFENQYKAMPCL